jgi:hypothetical protein
MRIIFNRKGFDTGSGRKALLIMDGRPISLPIPTKRHSTTTYANLGLRFDRRSGYRQPHYRRPLLPRRSDVAAAEGALCQMRQCRISLVGLTNFRQSADPQGCDLVLQGFGVGM